MGKPTLRQCEQEMRDLQRNNPKGKKFRVTFCKKANEWVVQLWEEEGLDHDTGKENIGWLCLHNDRE